MILSIAAAITIGALAGVLMVLSVVNRLVTVRQALLAAGAPAIAGAMLGAGAGIILPAAIELKVFSLIFTVIAGALAAAIPAFLRALWLHYSGKKQLQMAEQMGVYFANNGTFRRIGHGSGVITAENLQQAVDSSTSDEERQVLRFALAHIAEIGSLVRVDQAEDEAAKKQGLSIVRRQGVYNITRKEIDSYPTRLADFHKGKSVSAPASKQLNSAKKPPRKASKSRRHVSRKSR